MLEPHQKEVIALLYKQEMLLARLYQVFAAKFPEYVAFWEDLAGEEITHAEWVKQLYRAEKKGWVGFEEGKVKASALKTYIEGLEKDIEKAQQNRFTARSAIAYTLDYEKSLIERETFTHFEKIEGCWRETMAKLLKETEKHVRKAEDMMKRILREGGS